MPADCLIGRNSKDLLGRPVVLVHDAARIHRDDGVSG